MWSGREALHSIDGTLQSVRREVVQLDTQLASRAHDAARLQGVRNRVLEDIARVRLAGIGEGEFDHQGDVADQFAIEQLSLRSQAYERLNNKIESQNNQINALETQRETQLQSVNALAQQLLDIEASVQQSLAAEQAYTDLLQLTQTSESVAQEAEGKAEQSAQDTALKAKPYQQDALFMYLWQRRFGTTEYSANLFARAIDTWLARLIKYEPARQNFWNLNEIPKRLSQHADNKRSRADELLMNLKQMELDALSFAGAKTQEQQLQGARDELDQLDDKLEDDESALNDLLEDRSRFISGQDRFTLECVRHYADLLANKNLHSVHRYVTQTQSPKDDKLARRLNEIDSELEGYEDDLKDIRQVHQNKLDRLKQMEKVRRRFKHSRFDDVRSGFTNQALLLGTLNQFLQGVVSGGDLWNAFKRHQHYRDIGVSPDFGSDGIGDIFSQLPRGGGRRGTSWHWPKPRRGRGGFRMPKRSSKGGGFRTGGGF